MRLGAKVGQIGSSGHDVVSTDLFDTLLMRDLSSERARFEEAARHVARRCSLHAGRLSELRLSFHRIAYQAVAAERPFGDASLERICRAVAAAVGRGEDVARILQDAEVDTDIRHLSPNAELASLYRQAAGSGKRVIAITDTYYSERDIRRILASVVGPHPISHVYTSCDVGLTKHSGALFAEVVRREGIAPDRIVHVGDDFNADIVQARVNGLHAIHLPRRTSWRRAGKLAVAITSSPAWRGVGRRA